MKSSQHYLGNKNLKAFDVPIEWTEETIKEYAKCSKSLTYFIENYVKIVTLDEGLISFKLRGYQKKILKAYKEKNRIISMQSRQSGKSITTIAYLLWEVLFNDFNTVAILANKNKTALDLLRRLKLAYEHLPKFLQQGIKRWNEGDIELENGSKILACSTSSSAIRGFSCNILFLDEFAFVPNNIAHEFFNSIYPTISAGKNSKIIIVSTPHGLNLFYKIWSDSIKGLKNKEWNGYTRIHVTWQEVPGRDEEWKQKTIKSTSQELFDTEFECKFVGAVDTLVNIETINELVSIPPIKIINEFGKIFKMPVKDHVYFCSIDTARGRGGGDYSAFSILDITDFPYEQVCAYRNNDIAAASYADVIRIISTFYNDAYVLFELNDIGEAAANMLYEDEYENILGTIKKGRKGQVLCYMGSNKSVPGVTTSSAVKNKGCSTLKDLIEMKQLIINDYDTIAEISHFKQHRRSFAAELGKNDDLVMGLVLFAWACSQDFFKDLLNVDIAKKLRSDTHELKQLEEDLMPIGFFNNNSQVVTQNFW